MSFLDNSGTTIKADKKHEDAYDLLHEKLELEISNLFFISLIIGYRKGVKSNSFAPGKKEFRVSYLNDSQKSIMYTIANECTDGEFFSDPSNEVLSKKIIREFQLYATAGMDIIINDIFKHYTVNGQLNSAKSDYDVQLLKYLYQELNTAPF